MTNDINKDFKVSILNNELTEVAAELAEVALDSILDEGILKEVPIIGTIFNLVKAGHSIKERFIIKKLARLIQNLSDVPHADKKAFFKKLEGDRRNQKEVTDKVLLILDRLEDISKVSMFSSIFKLFILGHISQNLFFRMSYIIEKAFSQDLLALHNQWSSLYRKENAQEEFYRINTQESLLSLGLLKITISSREVPDTKAYVESTKLITESEITITNLGMAIANAISFKIEDIRKLIKDCGIYFVD